MSATVASRTAAEGRRTIVVAVLMASFMQAVGISLPNAALLYIQGTLSMSDDEVGWIFTSYIVASVITAPTARWLAGRYGRKVIFQLSIAAFALGHWERHRIGVLRAILLPASANLPVFVLNHLLQTFLPDFCPCCNRLQTSRTTGTQRR